jgi:hypothetical protein
MAETEPVSHSSVIERAGGSARLGLLIGEDANNVRGWKRTNSIPAAYWMRIVNSGLASYNELALWAEQRKAA